MHKPILALLVAAAGVIGAERAADAAPLYVNQSDPNAYDTIVFPSFVENPCLDPNVPCRTIVHAEDRADDAPANTVVVLPIPAAAPTSTTARSRWATARRASTSSAPAVATVARGSRPPAARSCAWSGAPKPATSPLR